MNEKKEVRMKVVLVSLMGKWLTTVNIVSSFKDFNVKGKEKLISDKKSSEAFFVLNEKTDNCLI